MNSNWQSVIADLLKKGKALQRDMDAILQNDKSNVNVSESNTNL